MEYLLYSLPVDHAFFCLFGIMISVYSLYIEIRKHKDPSYVAMCDFNDKMSCSKVLTSEYSKGFGVVELLVGKESMMNLPNCVVGIVFYSIQLIMGFLPFTWGLMYYTSILACLGSVYLAVILFYVLQDVCVVCITTYIVNGCLLYLNRQMYMY